MSLHPLLKNRSTKFLSNHWGFLLVIFCLALTSLYTYPLFQWGVPSGIDTYHYYSVIVKYTEHLKKHGFTPGWFHWWYAGYPESTFNDLATLSGSYISYLTGLAPLLVYNLIRFLSHALLGIISGIYVYSLTRGKLSAFFAATLVISSITLLKNNGMVGRFPTIVALPFSVWSLYICEKQINQKTYLKKDSILLALSLGLCVSTHLMVAGITFLLLFVRLATIAIYRKQFLRTIRKLTIPVLLSLLLSSYFLIPVIYERKFFGDLFWPSAQKYSLYNTIKGFFTWSLGVEPDLFFGTSLLIGFALYLSTFFRRRIKEKDIFLMLVFVIMPFLSWVATGRSFLGSVFLLSTAFDPSRFMLFFSLVLCIMGGVGLTRIKGKFVLIIAPLLLSLTILEALPLRVGFESIRLNEGVMKLKNYLEQEKRQVRIYTSGFRHFHALLGPVVYNKQLVGGWFYQGALTRDYIDAVKSFGQQVPPPKIKNYPPKNPVLFSNILQWFNCKYIILGYDWFNEPRAGYAMDTSKPQNPFWEPVPALFKHRLIGELPLPDSYTGDLEKILKKYPEYFSPRKIYGDVNMYQLINFNPSYSFLTKDPLLFVGPEENYRRMFLTLNSIEDGHKLVLVKASSTLREIPDGFKTILIYGIPLTRENYHKLEKLSQTHRVIFIQDSSVACHIDFFNKLDPKKGPVEVQYGIGEIEEQRIIPKFYEDFLYYSLSSDQGKVLMQLNHKPVVVKKQNMILSGFDLPKHGYYSGDKKELSFLVYLLTPGKDFPVMSPVEFKRKNADEFTISSKEEGWAVIKEAYFPYWQVSNKNRNIYRAGPNFMMTKMAQGEKLHFHFVIPPIRNIALIISLTVLGILIFIYCKLRNRKR